MGATDYLTLVSGLPRPSPGQVDDFVRFVSSAHSWYKHLPLHPDVPFHFLLDPNAGRGMIGTRTGEVAFIDRADESERFHYTWMTTADYRRRFGHLDYHAPYGTSISLVAPDGIHSVDGPGLRVLSPGGDWVGPAKELVDAGTAHVNALVHPHTNPVIWEMDPELFGLDEWKRRAGGDRTEDAGFLEQERARLLEGMRSAVERFLDCVFGERAGP